MHLVSDKLTGIPEKHLKEFLIWVNAHNLPINLLLSIRNLILLIYYEETFSKWDRFIQVGGPLVQWRSKVGRDN